MIQTLPSPERSAARAQALAWAGTSRPTNATPRLSVQREPIALPKDGEEPGEIVRRGRHRRQPGAAGARVLEPRRRDDHDDRLVGVEHLLRGELHHRGERGNRGRLAEDSFLARQCPLRLEDALVGEPYAPTA